MKALLYAIIIVVSIITVNAQSFDNFDVDIILEPNGIARESISLDFSSDTNLDFITYSLVDEPENIRVYDTNDLEFSLIENNDFDITIEKNFLANKNYNINLDFITKDMVEKVDNNFILSVKFIPEIPIKNFNLNVQLPDGFILSDASTAVSPKPQNVETDGRQIKLTWNYDNLEEELPIIVLYERGFHEDSSNLILVVISISLIILTLVVFWFRRDKEKFVLSTLSQDEKAIVDIVLKEKEVSQKEVSQRLSFSKSKMTKIVRRLEEKNIIEKKPYMKTNKLKINKKLKI